MIQEALNKARVKGNDIDHLLLHLANIWIIEVVADRLGLHTEKVITNLHKDRNTSAVSIPLVLDKAVRSGRAKKGDAVTCAGFGVGLLWVGTSFAADWSTSSARKYGLRLQTACQRRGCAMISRGNLFDIK